MTIGATRSGMHRGFARRKTRRIMLAACILAFGAIPMALVAAAQTNPFQSQIAQDPDARLLLEADQLIYDFDRETITAVGGVEINYNGYVVQAATLRYYQRTGRLIASGGVRIIEPLGNIITAEEVDITDDFRDGFIQSLNVETAQRARFSAKRAERRDGNVTVFEQGSYTACPKCEDNPEKPPTWRIRATKIIHDQKEETVRYENPRLEFLGVPIAYAPFLVHADPSVKRKSGLLLPTISATSALGVGVTVPYFFNLAPNYDITVAPTYYSRQGFHGIAEWRHRIKSGSYQIRVTGIRQEDKDEFVGDGRKLSGFRDYRGSVQSTGNFYINPRWDWGWDLIATSDRVYGRDYKIDDANEQDVPGFVYLNGRTTRNHFDARAVYFRVQRENTIDADVVTGALYEHDDQHEQPVVHPVVDHNYVADRSIAGGEVRLDSNITSLSRNESDLQTVPAVDYYAGVAGTFTRASTDLSWQRTFVATGGHVLTPFAYVKADLNWVASDDAAAGLSSSEFIARAMPAVGGEYRWPFLITGGGVTQTLSPIAQLLIRPDETHIGDLPNEDAHSLVFDDTILFDRDKFSGYDRQEGGVRTNLGISYQARFDNGWRVDSLVGQSIHVAGTNSYSVIDQTRTGSLTGLENDHSDYVGRVTVDNSRGLAMTARGRFDAGDLDLNRGEISATAAYGRSSASGAFTYLRKRPTVGIIEDRREITAAATIALGQNWAASGAIVYDVEKRAQVEHKIGLAYDDECFYLSAEYAQVRDRYSDLVTDQTLFFRVNLRTIGDSLVEQDIGE